MSNRSPKHVEATINSFEILETLVASGHPMGVTELSDAVDLSKGVVYNHLGTLSELGYVRREGRKYCPSLHLLSPGEQVRSNYEVYDAARSHVDNLAKTTGEVVTLFVEEDGLGICLYMTAGTGAWSPDYVCGDRLPLHVTAPGKALLAAFDTERVAEIVERHGLPSETDASISSRRELRRELGAIRENDIAFSRGEQFEGIVGVATSFGVDERAPAGAIGVCGPRKRLSGRYFEEDVTGQVISTAKAIQVELTK